MTRAHAMWYKGHRMKNCAKALRLLASAPFLFPLSCATAMSVDYTAKGFLLPEITMPKLIDRQIESDEHGYYCIDTYDSNIDYPFCGFGYSEHEAIQEAERQARKQFNNRGESVTNLA